MVQSIHVSPAHSAAESALGFGVTARASAHRPQCRVVIPVQAQELPHSPSRNPALSPSYTVCSLSQSLSKFFRPSPLSLGLLQRKTEVIKYKLFKNVYFLATPSSLPNKQAFPSLSPHRSPSRLVLSLAPDSSSWGSLHGKLIFWSPFGPTLLKFLTC